MKFKLSCLITLALLAAPAYVDWGSQILAAPAAGKPADVSMEKGKSWKDDWDQTIAGAKKEGELTVYGDGFAAIQRSMADAFKRKYGITLHILNLAASQAVERISRENRTGNLGVDVVATGHYGILILLKPKGLIKSLDSTVILPEALDPNKWSGGKFPWVDAEHFQVQFGGTINTAIWRNTRSVNENEIKKYGDLLNPKWKGKILMHDLTLPGSGSVWFRLYYPVLGEEYMKALVNQNPTILRDKRLEVEWLARGKNPLLLCGTTAQLLQFKKAGSPIEYVTTSEGEYVGTGPGSIAIMDNPPHPNAAKVFINWLLTKEGQTAWSEASGLPSFRVDVPLGQIDPVIARKAGKTYLSDTAETLAQSAEYVKIAKRIFAPILNAK